MYFVADIIILVALLAAFVLAIRAVQHWFDRRTEWYKRKIDIGVRCLNCGYDLRASSKRCPECGTPFWRFGD